MAHPKQKKDDLKRHYLDGLSLELAAQKVGIPAITARRWKTEAKKAGDDWDRVKSALTLAGGSIEDLGRDLLAGFLLQYQTTMNELKNASDMPPSMKAQLLASLADSFTKTISANRKILPETQPLAIAMEVMTLLADFICAQFPADREKFVMILEQFGAVLETKLGKR